MIEDIYSRKIVDWKVHDNETGGRAASTQCMVREMPEERLSAALR
jgi:hypothetical protein